MEKQAKQLSKQLVEVLGNCRKVHMPATRETIQSVKGALQVNEVSGLRVQFSIDAEKRLMANSVIENLKVY